MLVVALTVYLEVRIVPVAYLRTWQKHVSIVFALLIITLFGAMPKAINGEYETIYIIHYLILFIILLVVAKIDLEEKIIPNEIVLLMLTVNSLFLILEMQSDSGDSRMIIFSALFGFLSGGGIFILVNLLQKNGVGAGDIKLFAVIGIPLGFVGIISICLNTFILAAIASLVLLRLKKINKGGRIPLAPFILLSVLIYG